MAFGGPSFPSCLSIVFTAAAAAAEAPPPRYDLRPGDRLVYRAVLDRELQGAATSSATRVEWESQVVVLEEVGGTLGVGFQRTRRRAELLRFRGPGNLQQERTRFEEELARRPAVVAEANGLAPDGRAGLPWLAVREGTGELLPFIHEIEPLPAKAVAPGDRWTGGAPLGLPFRAVGFETVSGEPCLRADGEAGPIKLRYWFCAGSGTLGRLEYEGRYAVFGAEVLEKLVVERIDRRRGEDPRAWLADPDARQAALAARLVAPSKHLASDSVYPLLEDADAAVHRQVLALAWREGWPPPSADTLRRLLGSENARVRALATRLAGPPSAAPVPDDLAKMARVVRGGAPLPDWRCRDDPDRAAHALLAQRADPQPPGSTLRFMRTASFEGRPYILHVPEDYRGDEPFPLLIVLGGGAGRAFPTAQGAFRVVDPLGFLAVYPQASGMWWDEASIAGMAALIPEVLADYNVDTNRVYLTGFSNGGTGTFLFAALFPDRLAAAAPLMGAGLSLVPSVAGLTRLPLLFLHGDRDEVIPVQGSLESVKAIRHADPRAPVEEHVLKGRGHDVRLGSDDGLTLPFLERHARDPFPKSVRLRSRDLAFARAFWIDVLEKSGGTAEADGDIEGSRVSLRTRNVKRLRLRLRRELLSDPAALRVSLNGRDVFTGPLEEDCGLLARSWRETGDPFLAHSWERTFAAAP